MSGWGEMGWRFLSLEEKICRACKRPLKMDDVGEDRTVHRTNKRDFLCKGCMRERSEATIPYSGH